MSDANRTVLRYVEEVTWGEVPSGPPAFTDLRETGEGLKGTKQTEMSEEIRSDRQIPKIIRTGEAAEGPVNFELSYGSYDDWLAAVLMAAAWSGAQSVVSAEQVDVTAATKLFTKTATTWANTPVVGEWVRVSGFLGAAAVNNGYFKVAASPAPTTTIFHVTNGDDLVDATGTGAETITQGDSIVNGVAETSYSIEREYEDLTNVFALYRGMMIEGMALDIPVDGRITGSFDFMGKDEQANAATAGDGSPVATNENDIVSSANDIQFINVDHSSVCLLSGSIAVTNNLREIRCAGTLGVNSIGVGRFGVTGDAELLFSDNTQKAKFLAHTASAIAISIEDGMTSGALALGNGYIIEIPSVQFVDDETVAGGVDTELPESISWEAFMNATENITMRIIKFPAA